MEDKILEEIKNFAVKKLNETYGSCGCASGDDFAMLNSEDRNGIDIRITIKAKKEE